jgi:hypothetical protein
VASTWQVLRPDTPASEYPFLSSTGRFVAFQSQATNLVGNDTNATTDIYVRGPLGQ